MTAFLVMAAALFVVAHSAQHDGGFVLAGDRVAFDIDRHPHFNAHQIQTTSDATRAGFERWSRTAEGQSIIRRFQESDRTVVVHEDSSENAPGRAPQPGLRVMLAAHDRSVAKQYELILNPTLAAQYHTPTSVNLGLPRTAADVMALAWAGEMLHIDFYADGVQLPHHERTDFQQRWLLVATELGLPNTPHD